MSKLGIVLIVVILAVGGTALYSVTRPEPDFKVKDLSISQKKVAKGELVTAQVRVANVGDAKGTYTVKLKLDGRTLMKKVTLEAGESRSVDFDIEKQGKGIYSLNIEDLSQSFEVVEPAKFEYGNLQVSPKKVAPGGTVTISLNVKNVGGIEDNHTVKINVDGELEDKKKVTLSSNETTRVTFTTTKDTGKFYSVEIGALSDTFRVLKPANFEVNDLQISPKEAELGETVTVTVDVKNTGGVKGPHELKLEVDGTVEKTREVTLDSGSETTESFSLMRETAKSYSVKIGALSQSFEVLEPAKFKVTLVDKFLFLYKEGFSEYFCSPLPVKHVLFHL